jgi:hypothetical protein
LKARPKLPDTFAPRDFWHQVPPTKQYGERQLHCPEEAFAIEAADTGNHDLDLAGLTKDRQAAG